MEGASMEMTEKAIEQRKRKYDYHKAHFIKKLVVFSNINDSEMEMLNWLNQQSNFSAYIKKLIQADMDQHKNIQE